MAVPRLLDERCFVELKRAGLDARGVPLEDAADAKGALRFGRLLAFDEMQPIDLVLVGCVAVSREGGRTGKGAGFADIELGLLRHFKRVSTATPIATTVHPLQIVANAALTMRPHDSALHWIATPDVLIETHTPYPQPTGLLWDALRPEQWEKIPVLKKVAGRE
jgi:5-formyltetrahydrofolate cyclo-ligase